MTQDDIMHQQKVMAFYGIESITSMNESVQKLESCFGAIPHGTAEAIVTFAPIDSGVRGTIDVSTPWGRFGYTTDMSVEYGATDVGRAHMMMLPALLTLVKVALAAFAAGHPAS